MKKNYRSRMSIAVLSCLSAWAASGHAYDLKEAAQEAVLHNPEVVSRWHNYRETTENIDVAKGGYFPKADVSTGIKREHLVQPGVPEARYTTKGTSLFLNQMLFDGFATKSEIERLSYMQRVRYYELLDSSETTALEAARAYTDVMRYRKLVQLAQENYVQHRAIHQQIGRRVKAGVGRQVDLEQAGGRLALAESNLLVEASNLHDVSARFERVIGKIPPADMKGLALLDQELPKTKADAVSTGYQNNASILAAQENIISSTADARGTNAAFMPKVYFQARRELGHNVDGVEGNRALTSYGVVLNMNLFNGGSDSAKKRQYVERVNIAKDLRDKACRDIRQTVTIGFNDIRKLAEQLEYLDQHQLATEKARDAYRKQFDIGQRTLLDLLDTENELFDARRAYQNALHDRYHAYARTQAGMGKLLQRLGLQHLETADLAKQEEVADFDPAVVCPPEGDMEFKVDKDQIFADAVKSRPELLPPPTTPSPVRPVQPENTTMKPATSALVPTSKAAPTPAKPKPKAKVKKK